MNAKVVPPFPEAPNQPKLIECMVGVAAAAAIGSVMLEARLVLKAPVAAGVAFVLFRPKTVRKLWSRAGSGLACAPALPSSPATEPSRRVLQGALARAAGRPRPSAEIP